MKKLKLILAGLFVIGLSLGLVAQSPPDPPGHGETTDQEPGGQAPIGGGVLLLLGLGLVYGGKKVYDLRQKASV